MGSLLSSAPSHKCGYTHTGSESASVCHPLDHRDIGIVKSMSTNHVLWCNAADIDNIFDIGASENPPADRFTPGIVSASIGYASSQVTSRLRTRFIVPDSIDLSDVPDDIQRITATIAGYRLIVWRGIRSNETGSDVDAVYRQMYEDATGELDDIINNRSHPYFTSITDSVFPYNWGSADPLGAPGSMISGVGTTGTSARSPNRGWAR